MSKAYIIGNDFHGEKVIAQVDTDLKGGAAIEYGHITCEEALNASLDTVIINAQRGRISRAKKWDAEHVEFFGEEIRPGEFRII